MSMIDSKDFSSSFFGSWVLWNLISPRHLYFNYSESDLSDEFGLYCAGGEL